MDENNTELFERFENCAQLQVMCVKSYIRQHIEIVTKLKTLTSILQWPVMLQLESRLKYKSMDIH